MTARKLDLAAAVVDPDTGELSLILVSGRDKFEFVLDGARPGRLIASLGRALERQAGQEKTPAEAGAGSLDHSGGTASG